MFRNSMKLVVPTLLCLGAMLVCLLLAKPAQALQSFMFNSGSSDSIEFLGQNTDLAGLEYLQMEPLVISSNEILASIRSADERVAVYPEDIAYTFPLRTNHPVKIRNPDEDDKSIAPNRYVAIGFVDANGGRGKFNAKSLKTMFNVELHNEGNLPTSQQIVMQDSVLVADASGDFRQYLRNSKFTLLVKDRITGKAKTLAVNPNAVCRDALNGVLTNNFKRLPLF